MKPFPRALKMNLLMIDSPSTSNLMECEVLPLPFSCMQVYVPASLTLSWEMVSFVCEIKSRLVWKTCMPSLSQETFGIGTPFPMHTKSIVCPSLWLRKLGEASTNVGGTLKCFNNLCKKPFTTDITIKFHFLKKLRNLSLNRDDELLNHIGQCSYYLYQHLR